MMKTIICFRQGGNNLRLGNTLTWIEQAIDWCKRHDFTFWLPNAEEILGELCDDSSDVFSMPLNWEKSIFYQSEKLRGFLGRIVQSMNEVKEKESVSNFAFTCSMIPEVIAYIDPKSNTDWSETPTDLIRFFKKHKLVIVNDPYPFKFSEISGNTNLYLLPSKGSIDFAKQLLNKNTKNIGIHIRQGDYKNWQGGKYYQSSEFYNELIEAILNSYNCANINLFIAHNGEFEISQSNKKLLPNDRLICSNHNFSDAIKDFLVLSSCDFVIGPLSTFSRQALMWGKKYNNVSGKWLPIDSKSNISDILYQINCHIISEKNNSSTPVVMPDQNSDPCLKPMSQFDHKINQKEIKSNNQNLELLDLIVCSYGGAGTTFFMQFLEQYKKVNSPVNKDGLKHIDKPPSQTNLSNFKALYMFGDPLNAVISLFQRNYQSPHSHKLLVNYPDIKPIAQNCTLADYLEEGVDKFKLEQHFDNWVNSKTTYPIMLIKYEKMWDNLEEIFAFLEIPVSCIEKLKKSRRLRNSNSQTLSKEMKNQLYHMYGIFADKVSNYDDIKIINSVQK